VKTETTPPVAPMDLVRLRRTSVVLQLLAAHPEVAAASIDWEISDRDDLWAKIKYGLPESEASARTLAAALDTKVLSTPVNGRTMYAVYGEWAGVRVSLHAFGPRLAAAGEVSA
jgi:hypothetical protein